MLCKRTVNFQGHADNLILKEDKSRLCEGHKKDITIYWPIDYFKLGEVNTLDLINGVSYENGDWMYVIHFPFSCELIRDCPNSEQYNNLMLRTFLQVGLMRYLNISSYPGNSGSAILTISGVRSFCFIVLFLLGMKQELLIASSKIPF